MSGSLRNTLSGFQRYAVIAAYAAFIAVGLGIGIWFNWVIIGQIGINRFIGYILILVLCSGCCIVCHEILSRDEAGEARR